MLQELINAGAALLGANSAREANKTNVRLQRNQQNWEERMSNTAVQRRADDIQKAGGNRALAFVNGSEASTPNVAPAKVDAVPYNPPDITSAKLARAQMQNIAAQTGLTTEQTEVARATADNIRQQTITGANTAAQIAQQTKNLEQQIENLRAELAGKLTANEISRITAGVAGKTQEEQIAIIQANLRRARAEATSAEKKALLDQAIIDTIDWAKAKAATFMKPQLSTGKSYIKQMPKKTPPKKSGYVPYEGY